MLSLVKTSFLNQPDENDYYFPSLVSSLFSIIESPPMVISMTITFLLLLSSYSFVCNEIWEAFGLGRQLTVIFGLFSQLINCLVYRILENSKYHNFTSKN